SLAEACVRYLRIMGVVVFDLSSGGGGAIAKVTQVAGKPSLPVSLLLRIAGLLVVAAAFFAEYVFEGTGSLTGQIAVFAVFGIACQLLGWNRLVLLVALVLGPLLEENIRRALLLSNGAPSTFLRWPISGTLSLLAAAILTVAVVLSAWRALPRRRPALRDSPRTR